jgi:hypothetical protein
VQVCDNTSSSDARDLPPFVVKNSPLELVPPSCESVTGSDDRRNNSGTGGSQPEEPEGGLLSSATVKWSDLQAERDSLPVESIVGNQVDTDQNFQSHKTRRNVVYARGQEINKIDEVVQTKINESCRKQVSNKRDYLMGFVPVQISNLSLEEVEISKHTCVGVASPICCSENKDPDDCRIHIVQRVENGKIQNKQPFQEYLEKELDHLQGRDRQILETVLRKYSHLFYGFENTDIGCTSQVQHAIDTGDARPIKKNPYRIPHALKPVVREQIEEMLDKGIIEPSTSPWSSSIVLVQKKTKDGSIKYRLCIDYRALNAVTKPDAYAIPNIVDTLDSLGNSKIFSVLDMALGYHQIQMEPQSREKTAFSSYEGHYQFIKMPFGLNNAPATYQRCIDAILIGLKGIDCLVYLDDIICFSATIEEHVQKLDFIFKRLEQANFKIQPEKCVFATDTVEYLGHICTPSGIRPDPNKVKAIKQYPIPKTVRDIRAFIGLARYYRRHVRNFSEIANPLTNLTKKDVPFIWTDEHQQAFDMLKEILC